MIVFIAFVALLYAKKPDALPFSTPSPIIVSRAFLLVEINVITFFIATVLDKRQDRLTEMHNDIDLFYHSYNSIIDFLTDKNARFLGMFGVIVIIYIIASLALQLKVRDIILSLWVLSVFVATHLLKGYTSYQPSWVMQRALIIIPVVIVGITLTVYDFIIQYKIRINQGVVVVLILSFGFIGLNNFKQVNQSFTYFNYIQPLKYMFHDLEETTRKDNLDCMDEFNLILYTDNELIKNPADYSQFLYPNAKVYVSEYGQFPKNIDFSLITYVYSDNEFHDGIPLDVYTLLTFKNKKHNMIINWYKGSINNNNSFAISFTTDSNLTS